REPRRLGGRARPHGGDLSSRDGTGRAPARARCVSGMIGMEPRPRVAITMGDAAGIGPEIIVRSLADPVAATWAVPVVLGDARVLERAIDVAGVRLSLRRISRPGEAEGRPGTLDVVDYVRKDRVLDRLVLADAALRDMGIARPRLVVAGLNPHAGESGAFGREEQEEIVPAIAAARERGIDAEGPFPADTVFLKARD